MLRQVNLGTAKQNSSRRNGPVRAGIDPRHLLIDWEMDDDNVKAVQN